MSAPERVWPVDRDRPREPLLVRPFESGTIAGILGIAATLIAIIGGAVASRDSPLVTVPLLVIPIAVMTGFAVAQWLQMRASGADPVSCWQLLAVVVGLLLWYLSPRVPQPLADLHNARAVCSALPIPLSAHADCLQHAAQAFDNARIVWWAALALILLLALLARRSRIAAWAAIPTGLVGCVLANNMLEQVLVHFGISG